MIHLPKTPRPDIEILLKNEADKSNGDYNLEIVQEQLDLDFKNKCYLCEDSELTNIQTEHFIPHKGDKTLKFAWNNLFNSCPHCNNSKSDYYRLLDCTDRETNIEDQIELNMEQFPKIHIRVLTHPIAGYEAACQNTADLLNDIYQGKTTLKKREAENLRKKILRQREALLKILRKNPINEEEVLPFLYSSAPFAGLQRWLIRREWPNLWSNLVSRLN